MFRLILTVALVAGVAGGVAASAIQAYTTTPLIHLAEKYEDGEVDAEPAAAAATAAHDHNSHDHGDKAEKSVSEPEAGGHHHGGDLWMPDDGLERFSFTVLANIIAGVGFALIMVACFVLHGAPMNGRRGVVWGMAGFAVFALAPGLGLPPELPGMFAAELVARQSWWIAAAVGTGAGLWLMVFGNNWIWRIIGLAALAAPHVWGAPHPDGMGGGPPPELSAHFVAASLATSAAFWAIMGWIGGTVHHRLST